MFEVAQRIGAKRKRLEALAEEPIEFQVSAPPIPPVIRSERQQITKESIDSAIKRIRTDLEQSGSILDSESGLSISKIQGIVEKSDRFGIR